MTDHWNRQISKKRREPESKTALWPLEAKLQPPQYRIRLLSRLHLAGFFDGLQKNALTIVRTPAGYGKSTLLSQWYQGLNQKNINTLWINLDEDDREAAQFVSCLASAAAQKGARTRALVKALNQGTPGMTPQEVVRSVIREFENVQEPIVLFIDDYHLIEGSEIDHLMSLLLRGLPANLHIVLATRTKPAFPISTLRMTGKLQELTAEDLRFSNAEMTAFLGDFMAPEDITLLASRTEGWPVALQLACLWMTDQADVHGLINGISGSTEEIAAYMAERVMLQLPDATRDFLIRTSILDRINGDLGNAVCGCNDCWRILDELDRLNALIFPIDKAKTWYRHHQLFADFLRAQLNRRGEAEIKSLHRRASEWFLARDQLYEAVKYACKAGDVNEALIMLDHAGLFYRMVRDGADVYKKLKLLLPSQAMEAYPRVAMAQCLLLTKEGDWREGHALLKDIKSKLAAGHYKDNQFDRYELAKEILVMDCFLNNYLDGGVSEDQLAAMEAFAGSIDPGDHWYRGVLNNLLCTMHFHRGNLINAMATAAASIEHFALGGLDYGLIFITLHLGGFRLLHGNLQGSLKSFRETQRIVNSCFPHDENVRALSRLFTAEACYEQNRLDEAREYIFDASQQTENAEGWVEVYLSGYRTTLDLAFANQQLKGVEPILEAGRKFARRRNLLRLEWFLLNKEITYLTHSRRTADARNLIDPCQNMLDQLGKAFDQTQTWREREEFDCTLARLLVQEGKPDAAMAILKPLVRQCERSEHILLLIKALILLSLACQAQGDMDQASYYLRRALHHTRHEKLVRVFLDEGQPAEDLLKAAISHIGIAAISASTLDWIAELLMAFSAESTDAEMTLVNKVLTLREQDVLHHLKAGGSNKVIARALDMTDNAVKFHLKNIYRKLGVNDRRLAISVAEKHGLLSNSPAQA